MSGRVIKHVVVHGRVQGVGYRAFVEEEAASRGLEGWVRNCRDGTVEAVFAGSDADVAGMVGICRRGPRSAHVMQVEERSGTERDLALRTSERFAVLPTL